LTTVQLVYVKRIRSFSGISFLYLSSRTRS